MIGAFNYPADLQAPAKVTSDLTLSLGDYGLFVKGLYFYN